MSKVLIVVDMQNDFVRGSLANPAAAAIIPFIESEIKSGKYSRVLFTQDTHYGDYLNTQEGRKLPIEHCQLDTWGWEIVDELKQYKTGDNYICKHVFGFLNWNDVWNDMVADVVPDDVDEIVLVGTCTDICVVSNAMSLRTTFTEKEITVLAQGCAGLTEEKHKAALDVMESCLINVVR